MTGRASIWDMLKTDVVRVLILTVGSLSLGKGGRERPSAFACLSVGLKAMSYVYAENSTAQRCNLAVARDGTLVLGPNIAIIGQ